MASILKVDTLTGVTTAGSIAITGEGNSTTTNLQQGLAKMWLQFVMGTPTIEASFNVSSLTDTGTGDAGVNLTNAFSSATGYSLTGGGNHYTRGNYIEDADSASVVAYRQFNESGTLADGAGTNASLAAHGDLA